MIQSGAMADQPFDQGGVAFASRKHQRGLTISITRIDIGAARQQAPKLINRSAAYGVFPLLRHAAALQYLGLRSDRRPVMIPERAAVLRRRSSPPVDRHDRSLSSRLTFRIPSGFSAHACSTSPRRRSMLR